MNDDQQSMTKFEALDLLATEAAKALARGLIAAQHVQEDDASSMLQKATAKAMTSSFRKSLANLGFDSKMALQLAFPNQQVTIKDDPFDV